MTFLSLRTLRSSYFYLGICSEIVAVCLTKVIAFVNGLQVLTRTSVSPNPWIFPSGAYQGGVLCCVFFFFKITTTLFLLQELFKVVLLDCAEVKLQEKSCATNTLQHPIKAWQKVTWVFCGLHASFIKGIRIVWETVWIRNLKMSGPYNWNSEFS